MSKLRDGSTSSTPPPPGSLLIPSSSTLSLATHAPTRRAPSVMIPDNRSTSTTKNMTKSRSTQNLILPISNMQPSKQPAPPRRVKISRVTRRPPNLPTAAHVQSSTSSSASSSASSPTKNHQTKENDQTKKYLLPPSASPSQESALPLRQLDNTSNDLMPRWAQDCFYRTVVLGLKPLLLQDIPASPNKPPKRSSSSCSIESSDSLETASELQACTLNDSRAKDIQVRRSMSIPDYRQIQQSNQALPSSLSETAMNEAKEE